MNRDLHDRVVCTYSTVTKDHGVLATAFDCTVREIRQILKHAGLLTVTVLCPAARHEIVTDHLEVPATKLASMYHCSVRQVYDAFRRPSYRSPALPVDVSDQDLMRHYYESGSNIRKTAQSLSCTMLYVRERLVALNELKIKPKRQVNRLTLRASKARQRAITKALETKSQSEVAKLFDLHPSVVNKLDPKRGTIKPRISDETWEAIQQALRSNSVSAVAKQFNVSRQSIYRRQRDGI